MAKFNLFNLLDSSDLLASTSCTRSSQGSGFIDMAMGSSEFLEALLSSGGRAFYADNWSDHRIVELCFSKSLLFGTSKNEPRKTCHFNIKNRKQRELFLKTIVFSMLVCVILTSILLFFVPLPVAVFLPLSF